MQRTKYRSSELRGSDRRRGLATLEAVMAFPALVALAAMLIAVGSASVRKADTIVRARHAAWSHRQERPGTVFPLTALVEGMIGDKAEQSVPMPAGLAALPSGESSVTAVSKNHVHVNPWDDPHAGFSDDAPHLSPMFRMVSNGRIGPAELQRHISRSDAREWHELEVFLAWQIKTIGRAEEMDAEGIRKGGFTVEDRQLFNASDLSRVRGTIAAQLSGNDSLTRRITGPFANSVLLDFDELFKQVDRYYSTKNKTTLRGYARRMNEVVRIAGQALGAAVTMIDPTGVIDEIINQLPEPVREMAQAAVSGEGGNDDDSPDDENATDEEKAAKDVVGLIKDADRLLKAIKESPGIVAQPIWNLQEASHGRDVNSDGSDGAGFENQLKTLNETLDKARSVLNDLQDALKKIGIS